MDTPNGPDLPASHNPTPRPPSAEFLIERRPPPKPVSYWIKKLLVCNPFYLVSAGLLLYGFYRVSSDNNFPGREMAQLTFNFSSLQCYEILLVATAILLAQRRIWYDSNLLIFLENGLILVPFILVSQAALIGPNVVRAMCLIGGVTALLRFGGLKRYHAPLNLPWRLLAVGGVLLAVNVALPLIFRTLHESKVGTKPTEGAAYLMNQYSWLLILPAVIALANFLPRPAQAGPLLPQRRWIPSGLCVLWIAGTTVHLYSLGYVYNFDWEKAFLIPPLWVLAWTAYNRHAGFFRARGLPTTLLFGPALVTLIAAQDSTLHLLLLLSGLNVLIYVMLFLRERSGRILLHLAGVSAAAMALGLVKLYETSLPAGLAAGQCVALSVLAYGCYWIGISRQPKLGILGAMVVGVAAGTQFTKYFDGPHFGIQVGLLFLLLHSLLWNDEAHPGAKGSRIFACCLWAVHSLFLVWTGWPHVEGMLYAGAVLLLAACFISKLLRDEWPAMSLFVAGGLVLLMYPGEYGVVKARMIPMGFWVVAGSFVLFGIGTVLALTKSRWHPAGVMVTTSDENNSTQAD